jgi:hypothetical protein
MSLTKFTCLGATGFAPFILKTKATSTPAPFPFVVRFRPFVTLDLGVLPWLKRLRPPEIGLPTCVEILSF